MMSDSARSPELENRLRRSVAEGRMQIARSVQGAEPDTRLTRVSRLLAVAGLGLLVAGVSIFSVFVILTLVFHFSPG